MRDSDKAPIVVVGAGHVGLVTAAGFAEAREVRLVDNAENRIEMLEDGETPIFEPGLDDLLSRHRDRGRIAFFTDLREALDDGGPKLVFVAVGTPTRKDHEAKAGTGEEVDLSSVVEVIDVLAEQPRIAAVMKSTVPPETGRAMIARASGRGDGLTYLSCPEFLREGNALEDVRDPDRIVVGRASPSWASRELRRLHAEVHDWVETDPARYLEMDTTSAELVKSASNLHLAMRIAYANQIGNIAEQVGADVAEVLDAVGADQRIGPHFLKPGVGFGGSCFEKDVRALRYAADARGVPLPLADAVLATNEEQALRVIAKLEDRLGTLKDGHVALLGLAFKPETDDVRKSPAFRIARELRARRATLRAWDPKPGARGHAVEPQLTGVGVGRAGGHNGDHPAHAEERLAPEEVASSPSDAIRDADAVVLVTEWPEFTEIDWREAKNLMRGDLVIDGRNGLPAERVRAAGLRYEGTGRESSGIGRNSDDSRPPG